MVTVDGETLVGLVAVGTLPLAALAAIFLGGTAAAVVAIVGWLLLVPVLAILFEDEELRFGADDGSTTEATRQDPLDALRDRYARGELDDEEFEARLERLLETEDLELPGSARNGESSASSPDRELERDRRR